MKFQVTAQHNGDFLDQYLLVITAHDNGINYSSACIWQANDLKEMAEVLGSALNCIAKRMEENGHE
jgi:hypothetical protein